jgi:hypothetical protein
LWQSKVTSGLDNASFVLIFRRWVMIKNAHNLRSGFEAEKSRDERLPIYQCTIVLIISSFISWSVLISIANCIHLLF